MLGARLAHGGRMSEQHGRAHPRFLGFLMAMVAAAGCEGPGQPPVGEVSEAASAAASHVNRWYGLGTGDINRVTYYFDPLMLPQHLIGLLNAISAYNQLTGLDFRPGPTLPGSW